MLISRRTKLSSILAIAVLAAIGGATMLAYVQRDEDRASSGEDIPLMAMPTAPYDESEVRDKDIEFYARRAAEDPSGATDRVTLAMLLFTRSRSTGSLTDLARAESLARESITLRAQRNFQAFELLASILMARHDFAQAKSWALRADSLNPETPASRVLLGEIELELGEYDAAASRFDAVVFDPRQFTIAARLARWHELTGRRDIARRMLQLAIKRVELRDDLPREQIAWFHYRLGELELRAGNFAAADSAFRVGLVRNPDDIRVLGGLSRSALARGEFERAIELGNSAIAVRMDPTTLGTLSLAYAAAGDTAQAAEHARAMSMSVLQQPEVLHREWGLFLLDNGTATERAQVLARAELDLRNRKDVYGYDLVAWALYRNGRLAEARKVMALALSQNTQDVLLAAHAREIGVGRGPDTHSVSTGQRSSREVTAAHSDENFFLRLSAERAMPATT